MPIPSSFSPWPLRRLGPAVAALALLAVPALHAQQQHAHTHGRLELTAAIDARSITLTIEAPLDNLLGFERAPRSDAERKRVADMVARLNDAGTLFVPDPKAGCKLDKVALSSAVLGLGAGPAPQAKGAPAPKPADGHADIDISIVFACANAELARHIELRLFEAFPRVKTIDAQVASGQGQFQRRLTPRAPRLDWGR